MVSYTTHTGYVGDTVERNCPDVKAPTANIPSDMVLFPKRGSDVPDVDFLKAHFIDEGRLTLAQVLRLVRAGTKALMAEPNLLALSTPINICGDIHGQYYDLMKLFEVAEGSPPEQSFLFLGDYVDRGCFSIESFLYLLALKLAHPDKVHLLRGNHECRHLTQHFTFRLECHYKYSLDAYEAIMKAFDALPLAATVNNQFFCVHGGISPDLKYLKDINQIDRFQDIPKQGPMCDLLWSDPTAEYGNEKEPAFTPNTSRRCSFKYSIKGVKEFLERNDLLCIVRGHEAQDTGYRLYKSLPASDFPSLMTVFSAPNYVDVYKNKAAIVKYDGTTFTIRQFAQATHPFYLPKFIDAFDWSLPFLSEKAAELLLATLQIPNMGAKLPGLSPREKERLDELKKFRDRVIKSKVTVVNKVAKIFHNVRNERESVDELMNVMGSKIVPHRYLSLGSQEIRELVKTFSDAKKSDCINEMLPPDEEDTSDVDSACSVTSVCDLEEPPKEALEELEAVLGGEQIKPKKIRTYHNLGQ